MPRIIGYARVSSREQAENSHALEQQIARLESAGVSQVLFDVDSGSRDTRSGFNNLIEMIRRRECDEVMVTRLDRLTRSLPTLRKVLDEFRISGVNLKALDDSIDLSTAAGKFHLNMLGALAEMEVDRLSERVRHGWAHLRDRKVAMNPPFGYIKVDNRHSLDHSPFLCLLDGKIEKSKAQVANEIVDAFLEKRTLRMTLRVINERYGIQTFAHNNRSGKKLGGRVARDLFRFSPSGLRNWLTNPVLLGHTCYKRGSDIRYDTHSDQRLISDEQSREIESILALNRRIKGFGSTALKYPLSGLVFCAHCRSACYSLSGAKNYHRAKRLSIPIEHNYYFQCKNWRLRACQSKKVVRMDYVEQAVIDSLTLRAEAIANFAAQPDEIIESPELSELKSQLSSLELLGYNSAIEEAKVKLKSQIQRLTRSEDQAIEADSHLRDLLIEIGADRDFWLQLDVTQKQRFYRALVERVIVGDGEVKEVLLKV